MARLKNAVLEGVDLRFRNFAGREGPYNREGDRNFSVVLSEQQAEAMSRDGWNVKVKPSWEDPEQNEYLIPVTVSYKKFEPLVVQITSRGRTNLPEAMVELMDYVDILNVDVILQPSEWAVNGKSGVKAYLKSIYMTIYEDPLMLKYADLQQVSISGGPLAIESSEEYVDGEIVEEYVTRELEG